MRVKRDNDIWTIGGMTWDEVVASGYRKVLADPDLDDVEIWEIENSSGGWFHPVHIHLVDFQILSRNGQAPFAHERGPKDVVYVGEGETVRLLMKFEHHRGRYMIHCHNLPHEDHDMMAQFSVGIDTNDPDPNHPVEAVRPHLINQPAPSSGTAETASPEPIQPTESAAPATTAPATSPVASPPAPAPAPAAAPVGQKDVVTITTARHRLRKDMTFSGTSKYAGSTAATSATVVLYDVTPGRAAMRLGTVNTNSLGTWTLSAKPGPSSQVTVVKAESSLGGTATANVRTS
jgi:hypothetical protein